MTVVLAIVSIMTAIVLMNLPKMKGGMSIDVVAQEVAIYIRGAQVYSRATKLATDVSSNQSDYSSYGIHFVTGQAKFFLWADGDNSARTEADYAWGGEGNDPTQESYELPNGFAFSKMSCYSSKDNIVTTLDAVFKLPDPEAYFASGDTSNACTKATKIMICLESANAAQYRIIEAYNNGQIAVTSDDNGFCTK